MARRSRRQREASSRFWSTLFKLVVILGIVSAIAYYAYAVGQQLAAEDVEGLHEDIEQLSQQVESQKQQAEQLEQDLIIARQEALDYREKYQTVAPPEVQAVLDHIQAKMREGLSADRLAFVISQAREPHDCTAPDTRRFLAKTENYSGPNTEVRFNDRITVTGEGAAARNGQEQWFDPQKEVTLMLTPDGRPVQTIQGILPLTHALVYRDREYHFSARAGSRGFVEVSSKWCAYGN